MRTLANLFVITGLSLLPMVSFSQDKDSTGLPGDHFDLQGALELFKKAATPEAFEKELNTESNHVNNLDLNGDNKIDYVQVVDKADGNSHAIVMRTAVNKKETQDIAVIVLEKTGEKKAQLQIIGNESLYEEEKIVEPYAETSDKTTTGPSSMMAPMHVVFVNVWSWPCVYYMYQPTYVVYLSPWGWEYYPVWWDPWHPYFWHTHYGYAYHYHHMMYQYTNTCYMQNAQNVYMHHRSNSPTVTARYSAPRAQYKEKVSASRANEQKNVQPGNNNSRSVSKPVEPQRKAGDRTDRPVIQQSQERNAEPQRQRSAEPAARPQRNEQPVARPQRNEQPVARPRQNQPNRTVSPAPRQQQPQRAMPAPQRNTSPAPRQSMPSRGGQRR